MKDKRLLALDREIELLDKAFFQNTRKIREALKPPGVKSRIGIFNKKRKIGKGGDICPVK